MPSLTDPQSPTRHALLSAPRLAPCAVCLVIATLLQGCRFDPSGVSRVGQNDNNDNQNNNNQNTATCGNGVREAPEACDGADLAGQTCLTQGFDGGSLSCLGDCSGLDTSQCTGQGPVCGDGLREGAEACDGADLGGQTCVTQGFDGGSLSCLSDCSGLDTSQCTGQGPVCGDGIINGTEVCDGAALAGRTCQSEGFYGGTLTCLPDCSALETAACAGTCGDGIINGPEDCDGANLGGATCGDIGCKSGTLTCAANCTFDSAGCLANHDEDWDGIDDNCDSCPTYHNPGQADTDGDGLGDACEAPGDGALFTNIQAFDPMLTTAGSWTVYGGTWTYGGDVVSGSRVGGGGNYLHATSIPNVDYSVEATFHFVQAPPSGNNWTAVVFAWTQPAGNVYAYECVYERQANIVSIYRTTGGNWNWITQASIPTAVLDGQWHRLRAFRDGDTVRCAYADETGASASVEISGGNVAANMSGLAGLRVYNEHTVFRSFVTYQ